MAESDSGAPLNMNPSGFMPFKIEDIAAITNRPGWVRVRTVDRYPSTGQTYGYPVDTERKVQKASTITVRGWRISLMPTFGRGYKVIDAHPIRKEACPLHDDGNMFAVYDNETGERLVYDRELHETMPESKKVALDERRANGEPVDSFLDAGVDPFSDMNGNNDAQHGVMPQQEGGGDAGEHFDEDNPSQAPVNADAPASSDADADGTLTALSSVAETATEAVNQIAQSTGWLGYDFGGRFEDGAGGGDGSGEWTTVEEQFGGGGEDTQENMLAQFSDVAEPDGYEDPDEVHHQKYDEILACMWSGIPVFLVGPAGSGKNKTVEQICEAMGWDFYFTSSVQQEYKLTGFIDAGGLYHETEFYRACVSERECVFFIDEMDNSVPEVLVTLNAVIANGYFEFPTGRVETGHVHFVAAGNTTGSGADDLYTGRMVLDQASLDRFAQVPFGYDENIEMHLAGGDRKLVDFVRALRRHAEQNGVRATFSYRCIEMVRALQEAELDMVKIMECAVFKGLDGDTVLSFKPALTPLMTGESVYVSGALEYMEELERGGAHDCPQWR